MRQLRLTLQLQENFAKIARQIAVNINNYIVSLMLWVQGTECWWQKSDNQWIVLNFVKIK